MKKAFTVSLLIAALSSQVAFSQDFACKDIFDRKLERLENTAGIRKVGRAALFTVVGVAGMAAFVTGIGAGALTLTGVVFYSGLFGVPAGISAGLEIDSPRAVQIREAYEAQTLLGRSYAELLEEAERMREEAVRLAIVKFEAEITHPDYLEALVMRMNRERLRAGLPFLSPAEVVAVTKENIQATIRSGKLEVTNAVSNSLEWLKRKGRISSEATYDSFRAELARNENAFCPNGKAAPLKSVLKTLFPKGNVAEAGQDYPIRRLL